MDYMKTVVAAVLAMVLTTLVVTTIMSFFGADPADYNPYMYFAAAMIALSLYLSPQPISMIG
jgi:hypothetical protein